VLELFAAICDEYVPAPQAVQASALVGAREASPAVFAELHVPVGHGRQEEKLELPSVFE